MPCLRHKENSSCECGYQLEEIVEWFKHKSSGRNDPLLFDVMDVFGTDAYYAYYAICELYAQLYNDADSDGFLEVSQSWLFSQLHIEKGERDKYKKIFQHFTEKKLIIIDVREDVVRICIPHFLEVASNWVKRKRAGVAPPAEAPLEAPPESPLAEKKKEEKEEEEKEGKKETIVSDVIDYLNDKAGTVYRKSARESVNHIKARAKEGATLTDFKTVIDSKVAEWASDAKMCKYLRPSTLFNSEKFWGYLNASKMAKTITPTPSGGGYRGSGVAI